MMILQTKLFRIVKISCIILFLVPIVADRNTVDNNETAKTDELQVIIPEKRPKLTELQATSLLVSLYRHTETLRDSGSFAAPSEPLIRDELAAVLLQELGSEKHVQKWQHSAFHAMAINLMALRTRAIDDWLLQRGSETSRQIVNLGAGMCTRPYRLDALPLQNITSFFEVEQDSSLLEIKHDTLNMAGHNPLLPVNVVQADVTASTLSSQLLKAGFDPSIPVDWIAEGLLGYLTIEDQTKLFQSTHALSTPGSRFLAWNGDPWTYDQFDMVVGFRFPHQGFRSSYDTRDALFDAGWSENMTLVDDELMWRRYHRSMNLPFYMWMVERGA